MRFDPFLRKLEDAQAELATASLKCPADHTLFEYGRVVGLYAGLERAKELLIELLDDREAKDKTL